jgi:hypothetical protein
MMGTDQGVAAGPFLLGDQAHLQAIEHLVFGEVGQA